MSSEKKEYKGTLYSSKNIDFTKEPMFLGTEKNTQRFENPKYKFYDKSNDTQQGFDWKHDEVPLIADTADFKNVLKDAEKFIMTKDFQKLIFLDSIQGRGPFLLFGQITTLPELENVILTWTYFEGCVTPDTEVLTSNGWKLINQITLEDYVLSSDENGHGSFEKPLELHEYNSNGFITHFESENISQMVSDNHKMLLKDKKDKITIKKVSEINSSSGKLENYNLVNSFKFVDFNNTDVDISVSDTVKKMFIERKEETSIKRLKYEGKVHCLTVPGGFFTIRHNGKVSITGNSKHSRTYTEQLRALYDNPEEIFDESFNIPELQKIADVVSKPYNECYFQIIGWIYKTQRNIPITPKELSDLKKIIIMTWIEINILEGMRFYPGFATFWAVTEGQQLMEGTAENLQLICLHPESEILTDSGWKNIEDITLNDNIAQYDMDTNKISYANPSKKTWVDYSGDMYKLIDQNGDLVQHLTKDHEVVISDENGINSKKFVQDLDYSINEYFYDGDEVASLSKTQSCTYTKEIYDYSGKIGCVTMPKGTIVTRSIDNKVCVTGNCRDENEHLALTQMTLKLLKRNEDEGFKDEYKELEQDIKDRYYEAYFEEVDWIKFKFSKGSFVGMNEQILIQYLNYVTIRRMKAIGIQPEKAKLGDLYITKNPLPWIDKFINMDEVEKLPQEEQVLNYITGGVDQDVTHDDLESMLGKFKKKYEEKE